MKLLRIASLGLLYMKQLPYEKGPYFGGTIAHRHQWLMDALYLLRIPLRPAQTCSDLSVPLVALLDRALASTLRGGAVEMLSHYGVLATGPGLATRMEFEQDNRNVLVQYWPGLPHVVG
ncbi:hypothetical protein TGAM01_v210574 [Trichoderma gamsii]|uniref:Uncharacterized protein n=1 Tax=Trichoderma gamsii TaxID=398673 RepID=A0A2P4Z8D8_9HYPO|nr:hypothetical protein TGAM01_v210574 [Trichoderma gamsii]PON20540.1 hypothetical protein TGAM01_v210574 [Trichoderma gamsii]